MKITSIFVLSCLMLIIFEEVDAVLDPNNEKALVKFQYLNF
jgi:hypothetical protein